MAVPVVDAAALHPKFFSQLYFRYDALERADFCDLLRRQSGSRPNGPLVRAVLSPIPLVPRIGFPFQMTGIDTAEVPLAAGMRSLMLRRRRDAVSQLAHDAVRFPNPVKSRDLPISLVVPPERPEQAFVPVVINADSEPIECGSHLFHFAGCQSYAL